MLYLNVNTRYVYLTIVHLTLTLTSLQAFSHPDLQGESYNYLKSSQNIKVQSNNDTSCTQEASPTSTGQKAVRKELDTRWKWKYTNEQAKGSPLARPEESVDTRLANLKSVIASNIMVYPDIYSFGSDPKLKEKLEQAAAQIDGVDDELCGQQLIRMLSFMEELQEIAQERRLNSSSTRRTEERHLRLANVLDSYGKYGAGLMAGRALFFGSHSQCVDSQLVLGDDASLTDMRYCVAKLRADKHLDPALRAMPKEPYQPDTVLSVAICIPKSCHTKSFRKHRDLFKRLVDSQFKLPTSVYIDEHLELDSVFCILDDSPLARVPPSGYLLIAVLVVWFSLVIYATSFKIQQNSVHLKSWKQHLLSALDLRSSWSEFTDGSIRVDTGPARVDLNALNFTKVMLTLIIVSAHVLFFHPYTVDNPFKAYSKFENSHLFSIASIITMLVDSFFVITGIMMARNAMRTVKHPAQDESMLSWLLRNSYKLASDRYLRLIPMYFLVFWFKKSIYIVLGSGPMWDFGYNNSTPYGSCRTESWLTPLNAQAAFKPQARQCLGQAWSVANDIFYSVTLAPVLVLMTVRPRVAAVVISLLALMSNLVSFNGFSAVDLELKMDMRNLRFQMFSRFLNDLSYLYTSPYYRVFPVIAGIAAGFALHHYEQNRKLKKWPSWVKGTLTNASWFILLISIAPPIITSLSRNRLIDTQELTAFEQTMTALFMTISRPLYATSNAVLFLRIVTDWNDSFLVRASVGRFCNIMVKLNYAILLVHMDLMFFIVLNQKSLPTFSLYRIWSLFTAVYMLSCPLATILHVFVENPTNKLIKVFRSGTRENFLKNTEKTLHPKRA